MLILLIFLDSKLTFFRLLTVKINLDRSGTFLQIILKYGDELTSRKIHQIGIKRIFVWTDTWLMANINITKSAVLRTKTFAHRLNDKRLVVFKKEPGIVVSFVT